MKKKRNIIIVIIVSLLLIIGGLVFFLLTKRDKNTTLTILDKQWIESNKNKLIDIEIETDIPVFNYNGDGVFFDFLSSFEQNTGLEFNKVAVKKDSENVYGFKIVDRMNDDDLLVYRDSYVLVSGDDKKYYDLNEISNLTIGVLADDLENASLYLKGANNVAFKSYKTPSELFSAVTSSLGETGASTPAEVDAILVLKNLYMDDIIKTPSLHINFVLSDFTKDYVITLGNNDKLNSIIKKYYKKWYNDNYISSYRDNFAESYYLFEGVAEREKADFEGKRYSYGFVSASPYDVVIDGNLSGINASIIRDFAKMANIEISFEEYDSIDKLLNKFNSNKIDFFFNNTNATKYDMDVFDTASIYGEKIVYLTDINNNIVVNSVNSLKNYKVKTVKNSKISAYLQDNNINVKEYNNINDLINALDKNSVVALDKETYNYFAKSKLNSYNVLFEDKLLSDYTFTIRDIDDNKIFIDFFDFYLSFIDEKSFVNSSYNTLVNTKSTRVLLFNVVVYLFAAIGVAVVLANIVTFILKHRKKKDSLSKEHKLKYVDMLTSLKNRNYLNDNIEKWDNSEIYPQTIIIIDLNNVAYINDNYGHQEGDNLIREAANILIKSQISNTEIIRTNGNEFLIYMVGYDEKQVISYIRKLNKEFKELAHGFGAAIGYSTINDAIKTIDDAVNEATLDMRNNKEELQN